LWGGLLFVSVFNAAHTLNHTFAKILLLSGAVLAFFASLYLSRWTGETGRRDKNAAKVVLVMFGVLQAVHAVLIFQSQPSKMKCGLDFSAYYVASNIVLQNPSQSMYSIQLFADGRPDLVEESPPGTAWYATTHRYDAPYAISYIYPPFAACLLAPFARLPFLDALRVWNGLTMLLAGAAIFLSFALAGIRVTGRLALIAGVGLFSFFPFFNNLYVGQMGGVILFLTAGGVWLLSRGREQLSALSFAVATLIKLTPALAVPLLVFHRRWRWLAWYGMWVMVLAGLSAGVTGWRAYADFYHLVLPTISQGSTVWGNVSIACWIQQMFLGYTPIMVPPRQSFPMLSIELSKLVSVALYGVFLLVCWRRRKNLTVEYAIVVSVLLTLAVSPISWWHHYTVALLPLIYLWCTMAPGMWKRCLVALAFLIGTNFIGIMGMGLLTGRSVPWLGAVVPLLTLVVAFAAVLQGRGETGVPVDRPAASGDAVFQV
jgi:hypothetical protein